MPLLPQRSPKRDTLVIAAVGTPAVIVIAAWINPTAAGLAWVALAGSVAAAVWALYAVRQCRRTVNMFGEFTEEMRAAGGFHMLTAERQQYWIYHLQQGPRR